MNEYDVPVAAYTFHGDQTAVRLWLEKIRDAQVKMAGAKSVNICRDLTLCMCVCVHEREKGIQV